MSVSLRWVGKEEHERVAQARARGFAPAEREVAEYSERLSKDGRVTADDILVAERDGEPVGTATGYSMRMWVRGAPVACQGVAFVATVRTHRRFHDGTAGGVATQLMRETLRRGRERGDVVSALMPFRASFYEHFGYGLVERRCSWTIPLSILPKGPCDGFRAVTGNADEERRACRQRAVEAGQCDIERPAGGWEHWANQEDDGYAVADQPAGAGTPVHSYAAFTHSKNGAGKELIAVHDMAYESIDALRRMLRFFASLKDQFWAVTLQLPRDLQLNRLLRESQVPHRPVHHDTAEVKAYTRMQVRVLEHAKFVEGMRRLPGDVRGTCSVAIRETEGEVSRIRIDMERGRAGVRAASGDADVECADKDWASIVTGDLRASEAARLGIIRVGNPKALEVLDAFTAGPAPFCSEYF
jgi:predicted acetyltransferase